MEKAAETGAGAPGGGLSCVRRRRREVIEPGANGGRDVVRSASLEVRVCAEAREMNRESGAASTNAIRCGMQRHKQAERLRKRRAVYAYANT